MLCSEMKARSLLLSPTSPYFDSLVRLAWRLRLSRPKTLLVSTIKNEIHHPPRRHGGALRERITRRTELQERKEQVLEEQEGQASSGSVSADIAF